LPLVLTCLRSPLINGVVFNSYNKVVIPTAVLVPLQIGVVFNNGESAYTVLGERNGGKILVVELENFGHVGMYYDEDKGASIEKKYA